VRTFQCVLAFFIGRFAENRLPIVQAYRLLAGPQLDRSTAASR